MATLYFNPQFFRSLFSAFAVEALFPTQVLQVYWDMATAYVSDQAGGCYIYAMAPKQQILALNLMTAHIAALMQSANAGENTGVVTGATIDKVTVNLMAPPAGNQWQFWLNQTPYGQQLLSLLQVAATGGMYYGGFPVVPAFRR